MNYGLWTTMDYELWIMDYDFGPRAMHHGVWTMDDTDYELWTMERTGARTVGRTDGRTDGRGTDGLTDGRRDGRSD